MHKCTVFVGAQRRARCRRQQRERACITARLVGAHPLVNRTTGAFHSLAPKVVVTFGSSIKVGLVCLVFFLSSIFSTYNIHAAAFQQRWRAVGVAVIAFIVIVEKIRWECRTVAAFFLLASSQFLNLASIAVVLQGIVRFLVVRLYLERWGGSATKLVSPCRIERRWLVVIIVAVFIVWSECFTPRLSRTSKME